MTSKVVLRAVETMNAKLNLSPLGKAKLAVHALQGILIFLAACIAIGMDAQAGHADGRGIWFNVLVRINHLIPFKRAGRVLT